jgi:pimeloyl-ACP methyl ester carboxylesterase
MNLDVGGTTLFVDEYGSGDTLVCVHGSWSSGEAFAGVAERLAPDFHVVTYDRRGHSRSERPVPDHTVHEDAADLAAIIEGFGAPAHVACSSYGGVVGFRLAATRPDLFRSLMAHETPAFGVLAGGPRESVLAGVRKQTEGVEALLASQRWEEGARTFVDQVAFGPGTWDSFPSAVKERWITNAPTFLGELHDPDALELNLDGLSRFTKPVLLTNGTVGVTDFPAVLDVLAATLPDVRRHTFDGVGHGPHMTHEEEYAKVAAEFFGSI